MELNSETVIYLKDNTFIPEFVDVPTGSVAFCNSDAIPHHIRCRGVAAMPEIISIPPGKFIELSLPMHGRFEFSSTVNGLMKVGMVIHNISFHNIAPHSV